MALISLRGLCEQDEAEYLRLEKFRAYVNGTADQYRDDSECVRDNLYGGFAPRDNDAFTMHDTFMDCDFGTGNQQQITFDKNSFVPMSAVLSYYLRKDFAPITQYFVFPVKSVQLDRLIVRTEVYTAPNGRKVIEDKCIDSVSGYCIWVRSFWPD